MAKESPLAAFHRLNGAQLVEENGWLLPSQFGDPIEEYQAVRSGLGLADLSHRALLRFRGADRVSFLQGMVSNDVKKLAEGEGMAAAFLNLQGKILADSRILSAADSLLADLWEFLKDKIVVHLDHYLIADEVEITDLSSRYGIVSLQGPASQRFLTAMLESQEIPLQEHSHQTFSMGEVEARVIRSSHTGEEGYDLLAEIESLPSIVARVQELAKKFGARWVGSKALETLRIEAGIPRYGKDMDEDNLLLETGLDRAVSFQKGCYLGQEVVERIRSRGHVNRRLTGMVIAGDSCPERGDPVHSHDKEVGKVTSAVFSPLLKRPIALGYVQRDYLQPGTSVLIHHKGQALAAETASLPLYKR